MKGFSLVELLIAMTISTLIAGAIAGLVLPARAAFETAPAALDVQQRGRTAIDELAVALRSVGAVTPAVLALSPSADEAQFEALYVVTPVAHPSQGVLERDQPGPHGAITLGSATGCPAVDDVCGFTEGAVAAIADGTGRFEIFTVASASASRHEITAESAFSAPYPEGSTVVEVETSWFRLADEPDGSYSLVRETAGGAVQPIVDHVTGLGLTLWGGHPLVRFSHTDFADGPWIGGGPEGAYDASFRHIRRIDFWIGVEPASASLRSPAGRAAFRWVPSRTLHASVTLRNVP
jgi:prepilin-type N-terminal cleavage/methylation domain-containing protein